MQELQIVHNFTKYFPIANFRPYFSYVCHRFLHEAFLRVHFPRIYQVGPLRFSFRDEEYPANEDDTNSTTTHQRCNSCSCSAVSVRCLCRTNNVRDETRSYEIQEDYRDPSFCCRLQLKEEDKKQAKSKTSINGFRPSWRF